MRYLIKPITIVILIIVLFYLCFSFATLTLNPFLWSVDVRTLFTISIMLITLFTFLIILLKENL